MEQRSLGRTGRNVSALGLGTWQLGADWGDVSEDDARAVLAASVDRGVNLFDTADVYGDGRSETLIGEFLAERHERKVTVATKMGRRVAQEPQNYTPENFRAWTDRSRENLRTETLDLVQLHCPPTEIIESDGTYQALDELVAEGRIAAYGVSVETCDQALSAISRPKVSNIQIIINPFRLKPLDEVLPAAQRAGVAVFARVPLASGLLSGKYTAQTTFAANDHRTYNRDGAAFDRGETFSGVDFGVGVQAARELAATLPKSVPLAAAALAWVATRPGVTTVIPGARNVTQASRNADAGELIEGGFDLDKFDRAVQDVYDRHLREAIHSHW
ncbi:aldo/keto reductase [Microbacterium xanthum]|uniref:aldo/keto reductase n=1 Tax=Microbacterium xanthum TaxID=3079794 RepID=UPI002AD5930B|nr:MULTISPECIES: aldo/keto reductase [unclassified Microbacterium]MDZ8172485.1 aldo/keto reductase [Microbacterium sp. KSW-48]MDZ8202678.1 aldo/keto reductase [Microbacterium sp. SSW1-59]